MKSERIYDLTFEQPLNEFDGTMAATPSIEEHQAAHEEWIQLKGYENPSGQDHTLLNRTAEMMLEEDRSRFQIPASSPFVCIHILGYDAPIATSVSVWRGFAGELVEQHNQ